MMSLSIYIQRITISTSRAWYCERQCPDINIFLNKFRLKDKQTITQRIEVMKTLRANSQNTKTQLQISNFGYFCSAVSSMLCMTVEAYLTNQQTPLQFIPYLSINAILSTVLRPLIDFIFDIWCFVLTYNEITIQKAENDST